MLLCPKLPLAGWSLSWDLCGTLAEGIAMKMHPLGALPGAFHGGEVRVGWNADAFFAHASLEDESVFTDAACDNEHLWMLGDVFEMFVKDAAREDYLELHVAPNGCRLQLRFPSAEAIPQIQRGELRLKDCLVAQPLFDFLTRETAQGWEILASIPWVTWGGFPERRSVRVSFSRYDYDKTTVSPILSSTSLHREVNFHRQQEWNELEMIG